METLILRQVVSEQINPMKGGWFRIRVLATFGTRDLSSEPVVTCRGEIYVIRSDGRWQMPDNPQSTIKDTLLRVTNLLVSEPEEFREAFQMYARCALGIAQDPAHGQCCIWHL